MVPVLRVDRSLRKSLAAFSDDRLGFLDRAAALGPIVRMRFGPASVFVVTDADAARRVLVTEGASWTRPASIRLPIRMGVGENLFTQSDQSWARVQPVVAPAFRGRALAAPLERLDEIVEAELATIPEATDVDLELIMGRIALVVAAWVFLGDRLASDQAEDLAAHQRQIVSWVGRRAGSLLNATPFAFGADVREMRSHRHALESYVDGAVERATRGNRAADGVLGALQSIRISGRALTTDELRGHVLGLLFAGNETTAAALSWILVRAAQNPGEWDRVRLEPERTDAFVTETLRINPPAWGLTRTPTRGGVELHADGESVRVRRPEVVTIYLRGIHNDARIWPEPARFDPDRHLVGDRGQDRNLIPFALGPRGCIGQHLALAELRTITPALARRGNITISTEIEEDASFALRSKHGLHGRFISSGARSRPGEL